MTVVPGSDALLGVPATTLVERPYRIHPGLTEGIQQSLIAVA